MIYSWSKKHVSPILYQIPEEYNITVCGCPRKNSPRVSVNMVGLPEFGFSDRLIGKSILNHTHMRHSDRNYEGHKGIQNTLPAL